MAQSSSLHEFFQFLSPASFAHLISIHSLIFPSTSFAMEETAFHGRGGLLNIFLKVVSSPLLRVPVPEVKFENHYKSVLGLLLTHLTIFRSAYEWPHNSSILRNTLHPGPVEMGECPVICCLNLSFRLMGSLSPGCSLHRVPVPLPGV